MDDILKEADSFHFKPEAGTTGAVKPTQFIIEQSEFLQAGMTIGFSKEDFNDRTLKRYLTEIIEWAKNKDQKSFLDIIKRVDEELPVEVDTKKRAEQVLTFARMDKKDKEQQEESERELSEKEQEKMEMKNLEIHLLLHKHFGVAENTPGAEKIKDVIWLVEKTRAKRGNQNKNALEIIQEIEKELGSEKNLERVWHYAQLKKEDELKKAQASEKKGLLREYEKATQKEE